MTYNKLGTYANDQGGFTYDSARNPLLIQNIRGNNTPWGRYPSPMNPATFATFSAASAVAAALGGTVVADPMAANWNLLLGSMKYPNDQVFAIQIPGHPFPVNAGYICDVMGNDVAYPTADAKSKAICEDSLKSEVIDWSLAERIYAAL